jgi:hypothetical protein
MKEYDVVCRPMGGASLVAALCTDGEVHLFSMVVLEEREEPFVLLTTPPVCGKATTIDCPAGDEDQMCESCAGAAESWVQGGSSKVSACT